MRPAVLHGVIRNPITKVIDQTWLYKQLFFVVNGDIMPGGKKQLQAQHLTSAAPDEIDWRRLGLFGLLESPVRTHGRVRRMLEMIFYTVLPCLPRADKLDRVTLNR